MKPKKYTHVMKVNGIDNPEEFRIEVTVPGYKLSKIDVELFKDYLRLDLEKILEKIETNQKIVRRDYGKKTD